MPELSRFTAKAPSGMRDARSFLFQENDGKMVSRFRVADHPVIIRAFGLAEDQCICIKQEHVLCCGDSIISDAVECCKEHCLTCCDNRLYVATPGNYVIVLDEPNGEAIVTIDKIVSENIKFEVNSAWL